MILQMSKPKEAELPQHDKMNLTGSNIQAESLIPTLSSTKTLSAPGKIADEDTGSSSLHASKMLSNILLS